MYKTALLFCYVGQDADHFRKLAQAVKTADNGVQEVLLLLVPFTPDGQAAPISPEESQAVSNASFKDGHWYGMWNEGGEYATQQDFITAALASIRDQYAHQDQCIVQMQDTQVLPFSQPPVVGGYTFQLIRV